MLQPPAPPQVPAPAATPSSGGQEGCWVLRLFLQEKTPLGRKGSPKWGWGQPRQHQAISKPPQSSSVEPPTLLWHQGGPGQLLPSAVTSVLGWGRDGDPGDAALGWGPLVGAVSPLAPVVQGGSWGSEAAGWCEAATEKSGNHCVERVGERKGEGGKTTGLSCPGPSPVGSRNASQQCWRPAGGHLVAFLGFGCRCAGRALVSVLPFLLDTRCPWGQFATAPASCCPGAEGILPQASHHRPPAGTGARLADEQKEPAPSVTADRGFVPQPSRDLPAPT